MARVRMVFTQSSSLVLVIVGYLSRTLPQLLLSGCRRLAPTIHLAPGIGKAFRVGQPPEWRRFPTGPSRRGWVDTDSRVAKADRRAEQEAVAQSPGQRTRLPVG